MVRSISVEVAIKNHVATLLKEKGVSFEWKDAGLFINGYEVVVNAGSTVLALMPEEGEILMFSNKESFLRFVSSW